MGGNLSLSAALRVSLVVMGVGTILLAGCSGVTPVKSRPAVCRETAADRGWRAVRFQNQWPEGMPAEWYMDALIAHRVVGPILDRYRTQIPLWRFHRRAARDAAGHQFSFIYFADAVTACRVVEAVNSDTLVADLLAAGLIQRLVTDENGQIIKPDIADTSDPNWSPVVQRSWPYFIMGVSQTWLEMIETEAGRRQSSIDQASIESLQEQYRLIDDEVRNVWKTEGQHAFLHHLNAVFGYAPIHVGAGVLRKF